jgi:UDP-N-acetylmuramoylalanine--D-glutamate ligase
MSGHVQLRGKRTVVMGLGKSGLAAARLLVREGAHVVGLDDRPETDFGPVAAELRTKGVELSLGGFDPDSLKNVDLIVKSPGITPKHAGVIAARQLGIPIIGEVELCVPWLQGPIVAITGTNGKSTTTALTGHLLATAGQAAFVGGNLGTPVATQVLQGGRVDATVLELSSYQIDDLRTFECDVAAILNVTPDHLERYGNIDAYAAAKERLLGLLASNGVAILNDEDRFTQAMKSRTHRQLVTFGHGASQPGQIREEGGLIVFRDNATREEYRVGARALRGVHNLENAMAAIVCARKLHAEPAAIQRGLDSYPGLPHRIEFVRQLDGVDWINDSKATNVDSVEKSLAAFPGPLHLIMGGKGKGAPYAPLRSLFSGRVARLYVIGEDGDRVASELGDLAPVERSGDLVTAIHTARQKARVGELVLLSPACASFDQFKSFEHRGEVFRKTVEELK